MSWHFSIKIPAWNGEASSGGRPQRLLCWKHPVCGLPLIYPLICSAVRVRTHIYTTHSPASNFNLHGYILIRNPNPAVTQPLVERLIGPHTAGLELSTLPHKESFDVPLSKRGWCHLQIILLSSCHYEWLLFILPTHAQSRTHRQEEVDECMWNNILMIYLFWPSVELQMQPSLSKYEDATGLLPVCNLKKSQSEAEIKDRCAGVRTPTSCVPSCNQASNKDSVTATLPDYSSFS